MFSSREQWLITNWVSRQYSLCREVIGAKDLRGGMLKNTRTVFKLKNTPLYKLTGPESPNMVIKIVAK